MNLFKICSKCNLRLEISFFDKDKSKKTGLRPSCKLCKKTQSREHYSKFAKIVKKSKYLLKRESDPGFFKEKDNNWNKKNKNRRKEINRKAQTKLRSTIKGCINDRMSSSINSALKSNKAGKNWENIVGYSLTELKSHLERLFKPGMSWDLFYKGKIHIDHVIPKSCFHYLSYESISFKKCWELNNLQPMWAEENLKKHTTLDYSLFSGL